MKQQFTTTVPATQEAIVVLVAETGGLPENAMELDAGAGGMLSAALKFPKRFSGKKGQVYTVALPEGAAASRVVLLGTGKSADYEHSVTALQKLGGGMLAALNAERLAEASVLADAIGDIDAGQVAVGLATGVTLADYRFDKYHTTLADDKKPTVEMLHYVVADVAAAEAGVAEAAALTDGVILTRNLVSEPANVMYPDAMAKECEKLAALGVDVEVIKADTLIKKGFNALMAVGQGSAHEPRLVVMRWNGAGDDEAPLAFVGKGVTFDTGGISIKPSAGMEDMKWDMAGAGVVIGLMKALAGRKAKVNAVGVVGLVENMPSSKAQRPGDIVTSLSGQTIEVLNTDAEGRLVLADALWHTKETFRPQLMVDLATLTGAIIIALGSSRAGLFSNDDTLADRLYAAGKETEEPLWRLPLAEVYDRQIDGTAADVKNIGEGREAGSITAAQFLQRFVGDVPWAHLDIAGVAWSKKGDDITPKGGTGFGVRLLDQFVRTHYG